jgi:hypothetical protein
MNRTKKRKGGMFGFNKNKLIKPFKYYKDDGKCYLITDEKKIILEPGGYTGGYEQPDKYFISINGTMLEVFNFPC